MGNDPRTFGNQSATPQTPPFFPGDPQSPGNPFPGLPGGSLPTTPFPRSLPGFPVPQPRVPQDIPQPPQVQPPPGEPPSAPIPPLDLPANPGGTKPQPDVPGIPQGKPGVPAQPRKPVRVSSPAGSGLPPAVFTPRSQTTIGTSILGNGQGGPKPSVMVPGTAAGDLGPQRFPQPTGPIPQTGLSPAIGITRGGPQTNISADPILGNLSMEVRRLLGL